MLYIILSVIFVIANIIGLPLVYIQYRNAQKKLKQIETNKFYYRSY